MSKTKRSVKEMMNELDGLLVWFDGEAFDIELAVEKFNQAEQLTREIEKELLEMKNTITVLSERFDREQE